MQLFIVFMLSLFLTIALVPVFRHLAFKMNIVDIPDARKIHLMPMPKTGGISMAIGAFIPILLWSPKNNFVSSVLAASIVIVVFGVIDDIKSMTAVQKIFPQIVAALIVILFGNVRISCLGELIPAGWVLPWFISIPLTLFVILGVTNAINLSDGLDGLAGGLSMLSFIMIAFLAHQCGNSQIVVMSVAMIAGILGFLRYNNYPAILFLGDSGSQLLGFLSIIFAIVLTQTNAPYSKILVLPLIGFPILDTLVVMVERIADKRSPFVADKTHFHHRLLEFDFVHTEAVLIIYIIQSIFIGLAVMFRFYSGWVHIANFAGFSSIILFIFLKARKNNWKFRRNSSFYTGFKLRIKNIREQKIPVRICFGGLKYGFPMIFFFQILIPGKIPSFFSITAACFIILFGISYFFKLSGFEKNITRVSIYVATPLLLYLAESNSGAWISNFWLGVNDIVFVLLVLFVILTMNLTKRRQGFKVSPMDILIFIIIIVFPNLPLIHFQAIHIGMALAKALVLFFSFDVLLGELRGDFRLLVKQAVVFLICLALRGVIV